MILLIPIESIIKCIYIQIEIIIYQRPNECYYLTIFYLTQTHGGSIMFTHKLTVLLSVLVMAALGFSADKFVEDKAHTNIGFTVKHMVIATVPGKFQDYNIEFMFDQKDMSQSSVKATIKTASIFTDNQKRDDHLRSPDFFDAAGYPEITFVSKNIMKKGDEYVAKGTLTIRGISKEIELPFKLLGPINDNWGNTRLGIEAGLTINRHDFKVSWNSTLDAGGVVVSDDVNIKLDVEMQNAK